MQRSYLPIVVKLPQDKPVPTETAGPFQTPTPTQTVVPGPSSTPTATQTVVPAPTSTPTPEVQTELVGHIGGPDIWDAYGIDVAGNYAYVGTWDDGLRIIDISDPANPIEVGYYDSSYNDGTYWDVAVVGDEAYVANGNTVDTFDVSDPTNPRKLRSYTPLGYIGDLAAAGDSLYLPIHESYFGDDENGLEIVEPLWNGYLSRVGFYSTPGGAWAIALRSGYAYIAERPVQTGSTTTGGGLRIIDVSDQRFPFEVGFYDTPGAPVDVAVDAASNYAYVAEGWSGLRVINVRNPEKPTEAGSFVSPPAGVQSVAVAGRYVLLGDTGGLTVIDVTNPTSPTKVDFYDTPGYGNDVEVVGDYIYFADWHYGDGGGLYIFRLVPSS